MFLFGMMFLYVRAKSVGRLFQQKDQRLEINCFIKGKKSDWGNWVKGKKNRRFNT